MATSFPIRTDTAQPVREEYTKTVSKMSPNELIAEFLSYLDYTEVSDNDHVFHPITIGSCRVMMQEPLGIVLGQMRELAVTVERPTDGADS